MFALPGLSAVHISVGEIRRQLQSGGVIAYRTVEVFLALKRHPAIVERFSIPGILCQRFAVISDGAIHVALRLASITPIVIGERKPRRYLSRARKVFNRAVVVAFCQARHTAIVVSDGYRVGPCFEGNCFRVIIDRAFDVTFALPLEPAVVVVFGGPGSLAERCVYAKTYKENCHSQSLHIVRPSRNLARWDHRCFDFPSLACLMNVLYCDFKLGSILDAWSKSRSASSYILSSVSTTPRSAYETAERGLSSMTFV